MHRLFALIVLAAPTLSQGNDSCASAQPITGLGPHMFDNSAATTDGQPDALCDAFGTQQIENDVWFSWTSATTGSFRLRTCGTTTVDTKIAVYDGACGAPVLACNDDTCGLQSEVVFDTVQGSSYLIRVGTFPGAAGGTGDFNIVSDAPILNPANGHYYRAVPGDRTWDESRLAAAASVWMGANGHLVTVNDQSEHDFLDTVLGDPTTGNLNRHWIGGFQDLTDPGYSEPGGGWKWITGEPMSFTVWWPGEPNNAGSFGAEDLMELLHGPNVPGLAWNDVADFEHNEGYVVEFEPSGNVGTSYCGPAIPNSSGQAATIVGSGSPIASLNNLVVTANLIPAGQFGYFLVGQTQGFFNPPGSQGLICLTGNIGRYNAVADIIQGPTGNLSVDLTALPVNPPQAVQAGETWNFQCWFRDNNPNLTSNFTDGLSVMFL
ncbi:MAG: hypothetical protein GY711_24265 [bacterium]|nr:hypothetical protein [bacterium]